MHGCNCNARVAHTSRRAGMCAVERNTILPPLLSKDGAPGRNFSGSTREQTPRAGLRQNEAGCSLTRQFVGGAVVVAEVLVGRRMIGKPLGFSVPLEIRFSFQRNVPE